jgi:bifunctional DNA-binding transcriptional regulator/antitoxin component of YhaV-PrlF toxin-antitoxin module
MAVFLSKLTAKSQTVIPRDVRTLLGLEVGDVVRYCVSDVGVIMDKLSATAEPSDDALESFDEWQSATDKAAFGDL